MAGRLTEKRAAITGVSPAFLREVCAGARSERATLANDRMGPFGEVPETCRVAGLRISG